MKLAELLKQKEALDAQIAEVRQAELAEAISTAKSLIAAHGLTVEDLFGSVKRARKSDTPREKTRSQPNTVTQLAVKSGADAGSHPNGFRAKSKKTT